MQSKIKTIKARFRRSNINTFLFFLGCTVVIWIFVQFSKDYNEVINIPVEYVNLPPDKIVTQDNPKSVKLRIEDNGFKIAWKTLFPPTLAIDVSKAVPANGKLMYVIDENRKDIVTQLHINFDHSKFVKEAILIQYQQKEEKLVPLISQIEVEYAAGYSASEGVKLNMDSVRVSGPREILDTLTQLKTRKLSLKKVKNDLSGKVEIDTSGFNNLTLYTNTIAYAADVEKFTEGNVVVPIELENVPRGLNVVIFPKETTLFFQVNLKNFNKVTASDFRVVADFSEVQDNQDFLIPKLLQKPEFTANVRLNEKKIQFIIKK